MSDPKTPRDWLLARHEPTLPTLAALRRDALPATALTWPEFFRELFRPHRHTWQALAAIWALLLAFHVIAPSTPRPNPLIAPAPEAVALWFMQLKTNETLARINSLP